MTDTAVASTAGSLDAFVDEVGSIIATTTDEQALTRAVADRLRFRLAAGLEVPEAFTRPCVERYVMYPLHIDPDSRFSIAAAVWNVGQFTPVHGHETWGVVGIYSGEEHEVSYDKPTRPDVPLVQRHEATWYAGDVTVCCTTDDDVLQVSNPGDVPCVGIHVYGGDIGTLQRRSYEPATGEVSWFISSWTDPTTA